MKQSMVAVMLSVALAAASLSGGEIANRQKRQQKRIAQGVNSGELTAAETARLERKEAKLNREIRRDRADGGGLTANERARIDRKQDRLSRDIYREKHDAQKQK